MPSSSGQQYAQENVAAGVTWAYVFSRSLAATLTAMMTPPEHRPGPQRQ